MTQQTLQPELVLAMASCQQQAQERCMRPLCVSSQYTRSLSVMSFFGDEQRKKHKLPARPSGGGVLKGSLPPRVPVVAVFRPVVAVRVSVLPRRSR